MLTYMSIPINIITLAKSIRITEENQKTSLVKATIRAVVRIFAPLL